MNIGFIGLGIMGKPMAKNLLKAGHTLVVYDIVDAPVKELVAAGATAGSSPKDVAARSELIITMLPNSPHVKKAVLGEGGVIEGARPGSVLVDMSSIAPLASREVAAELARKGIEMLDAPVSGGEPKAIDGTLAIMVGGKEAVFEKVKDVLLKMGASAVLCGDIGAGQRHQARQPDHRRAQHRRHVRGFRSRHQGRSRSRAGLQRHQRRPGRKHRSQRQGPHGSRRKLQARIQNRAAHQGSAERSRYGARNRNPDPAHRPDHGDHAGPQGRRQADRRPWRRHPVL